MLGLVQLNGLDTRQTAMVLRDASGQLLLRERDLRRWGLRRPATAAQWHEGEAFHAVHSMAGLSVRVDDKSQTIFLEAPASAFDGAGLDIAEAPVALKPRVTPGMFVNYDLTSTWAAGQRQAGALLEAGVFNRFGSGRSAFVLRDGQTPGARTVRLETTWTLDLPERRASLRLGDAISGAGQWARPVRFGGLQWATNYATQPGFVAFPMPTLAGEAALPSTVDLYVNGALQASRQVPAGPFTLQQVPVMTGQGEARLVVRDLLGREQTIVTPYFATPRLLRADLHEFSYAVGRVRENYGLVSNGYGRAVLSASHRIGWSDRLTLEGHGEWSAARQAAGLGGAVLWPGVGTVSSALAASHGPRGAGALWDVAAERQQRGLGFGANARFISRGFEQLGQLPDRPAYRRYLNAFATAPLAEGSLTLAYAQQVPRDGDKVALLTLGYGAQLGGLGYLSVSVTRSAGAARNSSVQLLFMRMLDPRTTASASAVMADGARQQWQVQRNLPAGDGLGWRLLGTTGDPQRLAGGVSMQNRVGLMQLDLESSRSASAVRANAAGALAWLDGGLYAARQIDSSFALVQVPGRAGVRVFADNQLVAHTDADGMALVPRLRAYERNPLRIDDANLPLDTEIDSLQVDAVPAYRSGLVMRFGVRAARGATLLVRRRNGEAVPAGALASVAGQDKAFPFGAQGRLYLSGLDATPQAVVARWQQRFGEEQRCEFTVSLPPGADPLPDLGEHLCDEPAP